MIVGWPVDMGEHVHEKVNEYKIRTETSLCIVVYFNLLSC